MSSVAENSGAWLNVLGSENRELERRLADAVSVRIASGEYEAKDVAYLQEIKRYAVKGTFSTDPVKLEKLRALCQFWDIELIPSKISSHRPLIGPVIVALKKLLYPMLRVLLKDTLRKQRDFNAQAISLLAEICNEKR